MKKILFVSGNMKRGGAQRVMSLIANAYAEKGWDVGIALLLDNEVGYCLDERITLYDSVRHGSYYKALPHWILGLRRLIRQTKPDVIVSFVGRINMITVLAAMGTGIPVIVSERNDPAHDRRSRLEVALCRVFYRLADRVIFQTAYQQSFYGKACAEHSTVIGNPIAAPAYEGEHISGDIVAVGKLMAQKNHPMLIQAFSQIAQEYPGVCVHIYGDGELREELQNRIDSLGLHDRIILEGNSDRVFEALRKHRFFVMCSDYEGLSNALLEAMASGMVCISTDWNGVEDVLENGVNGFVVPKGDADALADLLRRVLGNDCPEVSHCAIGSVAAFSCERIMGDWMSAIEDVLA